MVVHLCNPRHLRGRDTKTEVLGQSRKNTRLSLKNKLKAKRTGSMAEEV
jgi:hypothetical protein